MENPQASLAGLIACRILYVWASWEAMLVKRVDGGDTKQMTALASQGSETILCNSRSISAMHLPLEPDDQTMYTNVIMYAHVRQLWFEGFANHHQLYINNSLPNPGLPSNIFM